MRRRGAAGAQARGAWLAPALVAGAVALSARCADGSDAASESLGEAPAPFVFAVVGDSRGEPDGIQPPVFEAIVRAIDAAEPALVLHTGDMIYGYTEDPTGLAAMWDRYRAAVAPLHAPLRHAPGNHDLHDAATLAAWRALWGPTRYGFDQGGVRFLVLDTETDRGRLGATQTSWLEDELARATGPVVLVLHQPVFPVARNIGASLDVDPAARDALHRLFVRHRDRIAAVFQGHDHLYHVEERDGVRYHIVAGGGAELYAPWEMGGYHHFVLARLGSEGRLDVEVREVAPPGRPAPGWQAAAPVAPGERLESWEGALWFFGWDVSTRWHPTRARAIEGERGLAFAFDFARFAAPLLAALGPLDLAGADSVSIALFVPPPLAGRLAVVPVAVDGERHEAPAVRLAPGWNRVAVALDGWIPAAARRTARGLEWVLTSDDPDLAGEVVFDDLRIGGRPVEGWESGLAWGVWNGEVEPGARPARHGDRGLAVRFDAPAAVPVTLYAPLSPPADLRAIGSLAVDVWLPPGAARHPSVGLALRAGGQEIPAWGYRALAPGWNAVVVPLDAVPPGGRASVEVLRWVIAPGDGVGEAELVFDDVRALGPSAR